jgi:hypothetical protein
MRTLDAARRWAKAGSGPRNGLLALNLRIHASPRFSPFLPHARARSDLLCFCSICAPWVPPAVRAKAGSRPRNGLLALKLHIHASPRFSPFLPHARARSELFCFCSIWAPSVPPAAGQKRATGPEMVCSPSNYVYTHRPDFLHFYRMHKLDLNYFVFARYVHPGCRPPYRQKWAAGPKMVCSPSNYIYTHRTDFLHFYRMCELDLNFVFLLGFAGPGAPLGAARRGAKAGNGPRNGLLALKLRIHASPRFSPFLLHAQARSELFCFCSICAPWVPPAVGQKRAAGAKTVCSPSNYVYTHRTDFLHFYRMCKLDLNFVFFPGFAGPGALLGAAQRRGKSGQQAQKRSARPQTTYIRIAQIFSISTACVSSI